MRGWKIDPPPPPTPMQVARAIVRELVLDRRRSRRGRAVNESRQRALAELRVRAKRAAHVARVLREVPRLPEPAVPLLRCALALVMTPGGA